VGAQRIVLIRAHKPRNNLSIPAAAGFFSLDASSGLLATASASAPAMFLALRSAVVVLYDMRDKQKQKKSCIGQTTVLARRGLAPSVSARDALA